MNNSLLKENKEARQAIATSMKREKFKDLGIEAVGPIPPISWAYNVNLKRVPYNPELAKKILKKSLESTQAATLNISVSYEIADIAELIKDDLASVDINTKLNTISYEQPSLFEILLAYWKVPLDPDQYYFWHSTQTQGNITNYKNVKIDKLLEDGRNSSSIKERKKIYEQFQRVIQDDMPAIFLYYPYVYTIKRK